jgi:hypothetical protein
MYRLGFRLGARREQMGIAISNVLALEYWCRFRFLDGGITQEDLTWLLIGVVLAVVVIWVYQRRRRRWF